MSNQALFKAAVDQIKADYPALAPEAVISFLLVCSMTGETVGKIAQAAQMTEPETYRHIADLQRLGLVGLENVGTGANLVNLTEAGRALVDRVNHVLGG